VVEVTVPRNAAHNALDENLQREAAGICLDDLTCFTESRRLKAYRRESGLLAEKAQAIILSHPYLAAVAADLRDANGQRLPTLHDAHNFERELKRAMLEESDLGAKVSPDLRERLLKDFERCEAAAVALADAVAATSSADLESLRENYGFDGKEAFVAPNGANVRDSPPFDKNKRAALRQRTGISPEATIAVFLGSAHLPNVDAAEFILTELAPAAPETFFFVVGGVSDAVSNLAAPENVRLFQLVSEARKNNLLALADIAINPVDQGSGTNLKLLEFLARGLPTIATPAGARGVDAIDGEHLLIAERPHMAEALRDLIASPKRRDELSRAGRDLAERLYDWSATQRGVLDWLETSAAKSRD
jgi:glycosyltransferase involved in cell wall biosynthesis